MLTYLDKELTNKQKRKVIKYMKQFRNLHAIIESREMDMPPSITVTYEEKPSQSTNQFRSQTETQAFKRIEINEYKTLKQVLDNAYESVKPLQQEIWTEHFMDGLPDTEVYYGRGISKRTYYQEKNELIKIVAECLRVAQISTI